jgi:anti-sigma B factor antagonist
MAGTFAIRQLEIASDKDICLFELEGSLQANTLSVFEETVNPVIAEGKKNIIFDCAKMVFASSSALGALMGVLIKVKAMGGKVVMANLCGPVAEVFELLDFSDVFPLCLSVDEAVSLFK